MFCHLRHRGIHEFAVATALVFACLHAAPAAAQAEAEASSDHPQAHRRINFLLGTQAILHSADMATTVYALHLDPTAREANPLLAPLSQRPVVLVAVSSAVNVLQMYTITRLHRRHPKLAVAWAMILIGAEAYAVTNNVRVAGQLRGARAGSP